MPPPRDPGPLLELQTEIESFLTSLRHPVLVEDGAEILDLTAAKWRVSVEFGKLMFEAWNPARSFARRVEELAYRDRGQMGLFVRKPGGRGTMTLELRELRTQCGEDRRLSRPRFSRELLSMLQGEYPGWRFERVSRRSDREHSFSAWYTRGLARRGTTGWAFLGLSEDEPGAAADSALAFGLIWLDWLRAHSDRLTLGGLKLFLPPRAVEVTAHRAAHLNHRALQVEIFEWKPEATHPVAIDLKDFGNVQTRLVPLRRRQEIVERHQALVHDLLGDDAERVDVVPDASADALSLRVRGLEIARIEGRLAPRVYFGLEGSIRRFEEDTREGFRLFLNQVLETRRAGSGETAHDYYRLQAERWLESMLVRDPSKLDPALHPGHVYPQVPAFSGADRGVIDILGATRQGRLAVIELKLQEEINLPLQGLDYWLRVKWLHEAGDFQKFGYFPDAGLAPAAPALYLVCPAFRFHSTIERVIRYFDPSIEIMQVGLNDNWRQGVKVLFRRDMRSGR
jgi:hypothetical protein